MTGTKRFDEYLRDVAEADSRWLAVFRIVHGLAMAIYVAWVPRHGRLVAFFTDDGVMPRALLDHLDPDRLALNPFAAVATREQAVLLFTTLAFVCLAYAAGIATRITAPLVYVAVVAIHHRFPFVVNGGMVAMHCISLLTMFLPLGRHLSVDALVARARGVARPPIRVRSILVAVMRVQLFAVYFFNVVHKNGTEWVHGRALHYALRLAPMTWPTGKWVRDHAPEWVLVVATYGTLLLELAIALAILSPFARVRARRFAAAGIVAFHAGVSALMNVGPFSLAFTPAALFLLTAEDGRWLGERIGIAGEALAERATSGLVIPRRLREAYGVLALVTLLVLNRYDNGALRWVFGQGSAPAPALVDFVDKRFFIAQKWAMFSANPPPDHQLLLLVAVLADGRTVDVRTRREPDLEMLDGRAIDTDFYWQIYEKRVIDAKSFELYDALARYAARVPTIERWPGERRVDEVGIHHLWATLAGPGAPPSFVHSTVRFVKRFRPVEQRGEIAFE